MKIELPFTKKTVDLSPKAIKAFAGGLKGKGKPSADGGTLIKNNAPIIKETPAEKRERLQDKKDKLLETIDSIFTNPVIYILAMLYIIFVEGCIFSNGIDHNFFWIVKITAGINVVLSGIVLIPMFLSLIKDKKISIEGTTWQFKVVGINLLLILIPSALILLGMFGGAVVE